MTKHLLRFLFRTSLRRLMRVRGRDMGLIVICLLLAVYLAFAESDNPLNDMAEIKILSGRAEIVDGDSIKINAQRIRLVGVDAPEMAQICLDSHKKSQPCGVLAKQHLQKLVAKHPVSCRWQERDRYNRILGHCHAGENDLNRMMVEDGWAVSYYSSAYDHEQRLARSQKRGMWRWKVQSPQQWRREHPWPKQ